MEEKNDYSTPKPGSQQMRDTFRLSDAYVMLNHGAYGFPPQPVLNKRNQLLEEQESHPFTWFRTNLMGYYMESVKLAANLINGEVEDTFILSNVTEGTNCILKSVMLKDGGEILMNTHSYEAVRNMLSELETTYGTKTRCVEIRFPISDEQDVVDLYARQLDLYPNIKIAVIDHITSPTALKLPVEKIVEVCRERNVLTLIDGAHAPGQLDLDMEKIKADFYVGDLHKWYYTSRGCALLWISPKHRNKILPVVTDYCNDTMHHQYCYWGTRDTSPQLTLATASKFYEDIGGLETITEYNNKLVTWAQSMLCEALGTKPLDIPQSMKPPNMAVMYLPKSSKKKIGNYELMVHFIEKYNGITVGFTTIDGEVALRLAANVYNCKDDYFKLRDALLDYFKE
ncbi:uncharacterized protein LOC100182498 [Ciona intestinalis]